MNRRRLVVWTIVVAIALIAYVLLSKHLASKDPIGEVLLGRSGSLFPIAGIVLLLRIGLIVVFPPFVAVAAARVVLSSRKTRGRARDSR